VSARTLGRVSKLAARLEEEELGTTDDSDDEDLILCRYSVAEPTGVSGTVGTGSEYIPVRFMDRSTLLRGTGIS
jgi:hypothetical protein